MMLEFVQQMFEFTQKCTKNVPTLFPQLNKDPVRLPNAFQKYLLI
jgi:hypothetical protein